MRPNLQPKIYKSPVVAQQLYHMYATTRYNFVRLKAMHKISPLEELVGGRSPSPPSSSQRLTGMCRLSPNCMTFHLQMEIQTCTKEGTIVYRVLFYVNQVDLIKTTFKFYINIFMLLQISNGQGEITPFYFQKMKD